jgi:hypothetical protein
MKEPRVYSGEEVERNKIINPSLYKWDGVSYMESEEAIRVRRGLSVIQCHNCLRFTVLEFPWKCFHCGKDVKHLVEGCSVCESIMEQQRKVLYIPQLAFNTSTKECQIYIPKHLKFVTPSP